MVILATKDDCKMYFYSSFYIPVFSDVINISKLAVYNLFCIMFKERHPPDTVPRFNAGLKRKQCASWKTMGRRFQVNSWHSM